MPGPASAPARATSSCVDARPWGPPDVCGIVASYARRLVNIKTSRRSPAGLRRLPYGIDAEPVRRPAKETKMPRHAHFLPHGVIPAVLLPFNDDLSIDEKGFRGHLRDVAATKGLSAITINAHSTEVASCSFDEQRRVLAIAQDEIGERLPIVHGVYAEGSLEAARIARMAAEGGAAALLVFPPGPFTMGQRPEMVVEHFRRVADAAGLPIIAFQYPLAGGQGYPLATLLKIIEAVPAVRAIKDWCASP